MKSMIKSALRFASIILLGLCLFQPQAAPGAPSILAIDALGYTNAATARMQWIAKEQSPPVDILAPPSRGLRFSCPFAHQPDSDRFYWDHPVLIDLSRFDGFELNVSCPQPDAIRRLGLYLKSGNGWYVWNTPIELSGPQQYFALRKDFSTEGKPDGWDRIEAVRLSPWKGKAINTFLSVYGLKARKNGILIVEGTSSTPNEAEQRASRRASDRISRMLKEWDIPHGRITDDEVSSTRIQNASILILPYNPTLPATERKTIQGFLQRGGRLVVMYSADPELARMMELRLGTYTPAPPGNQWTGFRFQQAAARHLPKSVAQTSWNIRPVYPANRQGQVIAHWNNRNGHTDQPAWVETPHGYWMTHILLDDDAHTKARMLLGLLGSLAPDCWRYAARRSLRQAGRINSFSSWLETIGKLQQMAELAPRPARVRLLLKQAQQAYSTMLKSYETAQYRHTVEYGAQVQDLLTEAYAASQRSIPNEFRGVWDHSGYGLYPGNWKKTCRLLHHSGMTAIFPNMAWGGLARYPSLVLPRDPATSTRTDNLKDCIRAAHKNNLEVHWWKVCWNLHGAPDNFIARMKKEGRLVTNLDGSTRNWLNPIDPRNRELELNAIRELLTKYEIDGIHLDYIRYPSSDCGGFSSQDRRRFEKHLGRKVASWPADVTGNGPYKKAFRRWRTAQITDFVRQVRDLVRQHRPEAQLSAAVYGGWPTCADSVGQDWGNWIQTGLLDFVCPMDYTAQSSRFSKLITQQLALPNARRIYPGIGVSASESQLTPDQVIEQIILLRRAGARGFMLYQLDARMESELLPLLKSGPTTQ
jgi:uncharacterized lipoprotein YddW (UPF0748 family)